MSLRKVLDALTRGTTRPFSLTSGMVIRNLSAKSLSAQPVIPTAEGNISPLLPPITLTRAPAPFENYNRGLKLSTKPSDHERTHLAYRQAHPNEDPNTSDSDTDYDLSNQNRRKR